jgi:DNA mismatch repair ATPase MutS
MSHAACRLMMYLENHRAGDELQQGWEPEIQNLQQIHMSEYLQVDVSTLYSLQVLSQVACTTLQRETRERATEIV